jgi:hypothetical protein
MSLAGVIELSVSGSDVEFFTGAGSNLPVPLVEGVILT